MTLYAQPAVKKAVDDCLVKGFSREQQSNIASAFEEALGGLKGPYNIISLPEPSAQYEAILIRNELITSDDILTGFCYDEEDDYRGELSEETESQRLFRALQEVGMVAGTIYEDLGNYLHKETNPKDCCLNDKMNNILLTDTTDFSTVYPTPNSPLYNNNDLFRNRFTEICQNGHSVIILFSMSLRNNSIQECITPRLEYITEGAPLKWEYCGSKVGTKRRQQRRNIQLAKISLNEE